MSVFSHGCAAVIAALAFVAPSITAQAQTVDRQLSINGQTLAPPNPLLLRADAPDVGSPLPDPSLANAYNFTTGTGINLNGVGNFIIPDPADSRYIYSCTASRIGVYSLLTAAHCVTDPETGALYSTSNQAYARFLGPASTNASPSFYHTPDAAQIIVNPGWNGFNNPTTYLATDMAVVNFSTPLPDWITTYGLYTNNPLFQATTNAGYGTYGSGTGPEGFDFGRRWGTNFVDYINTDSTYSDYLDLYTDFDDQGGKYDTFCLLQIKCSAHFATEAGVAAGDSGGPLFIDGLIAGVTSYGTYICDPSAPPQGPCVPFGADPTRPFDDYGALNAFSPVFANAAFIRSASNVPEPATIALVATGLLVVGGMVRRRARLTS